MIFTSEIVRCNVPNKNGHVYTKECIEKALEDPVIKERLENGCFFGGFMEDCREDFSVDVSKISHRCKELWWEGDTLYGKFEVLDTPKGRLLEQALQKSDIAKENCTAISGYGWFDKEGIVHDFDLMSVNFTEEKA